jgi:hypothetical protein
LGHNVQIIGAGAKIEVKWIKDGGGLTNFVEVARTQMSTAPSPSLAPSPHTSDVATPADPIEQLQRLGELRDSGIITAEEFEAKKMELMGRI